MAKKLIQSKVKLHKVFGRGRFLVLDRPKAIETIPNSTKRYGASLICRPSPQLTALLEDIELVGKANWGDAFLTNPQAHKPHKTGEQVIADIQAASDKGVTDQTKDLYAEKIVLTAYCGEDRDPPKCYLGTTKPPALLPRRPGNEMDLQAIEEQFYDGCFLMLACRVFPYQRSSQQWGVSLFLAGVKFMMDGERLGGINIDAAMSEDEEIPADQYMDDTDEAMGDEDTQTNI